MPKLNAVDAISPAFRLTKLNLFQPFRWGFWWRIALLGLLTGEMSSGGSCNFNLPNNWPPPHRSGGESLTLLSRPPFFPQIDPHLWWVIIPVLVVALIIVMLAMMYIGSVARFILLEAVLNGRVSLGEAWGRWKDQGARFFGFQLILVIAFFCLMAVVVGMFVMIVGVAAIKGGGQSGAQVGAMVGALFLMFLAMAVLFVPYMVTFVLAKDFAVPVMALEGATFGEAWRKVWAMVKEEVGSLLGYFGMKIVLNIGAGVIFGIIGLIVILIFALPVGGLGAIAVLGGKAAGMTWNVFTITAAVVIGAILLFCILFIIANISAPVAIFFPAYALYFFAGRYQPLHDRLFPAPPPVAPARPEPEPPVPPPDIPPEPSAS